MNLAPVMERGGLALNPKGPRAEPEDLQPQTYGLEDLVEGRSNWPQAEEAGSELGILVCENCGKLLKFQDVPCACGNREYFIVLDDCSLLLCMDACQDTDDWPSDLQNLL